jgi:hypothetical protein
VDPGSGVVVVAGAGVLGAEGAELAPDEPELEDPELEDPVWAAAVAAAAPIKIAVRSAIRMGPR